MRGDNRKGMIWGTANMPGNKLPGLRPTREALGVSRHELAERSGYSYQHIGNVERLYKGASSDAVQDLADTLGVPWEQLL